MNRGQYIAIFIGLLAAFGLFATATRGSDEGETVAAPAAADNDRTDTADDTAGDAGADATSSDTTAAPAPVLADAPGVYGMQGELVDLDGWLQAPADTELSDFDGQVHVVQFWTFGCINCKRTLDNMAALYERHQDDEFEIIGVHAPEFSFEEDVDSIASAAVDLNVSWPIALDTRKTNFRAWQPGRRFWPRTFVVDQLGQIRFDRIGEGAYERLNETVAYLIENPPTELTPEAQWMSR